MTALSKIGAGSAFGQRMKERRMALGFTLRDVEQITANEISNAYLSQLENGKIKSPSVHIVLALCIAYAVSFDDALSWLGKPSTIAAPKICGECGRALPPKYVIDERAHD